MVFVLDGGNLIACFSNMFRSVSLERLERVSGFLYLL